ncbi:MAG: hypothetical protein LBR79_01505 [Oscillospiraceae bacterium]|jgi:hypothetical protein|nr:hypothetical protein [Oscillospiraceae bacterium]
MNTSIEELKDILSDKDNSPEIKRQKWSGFVESEVVNFFDEHKIEKLTVEDGNGNRAKLARTKDGGIKTEYSSIVIL